MLGWGTKIIRLAGLHVPFNLSLECEVSGAKQYYDDYKMTPFLQSIQTQKWKIEEEEIKHKVEQIKMRAKKVQKKLEATIKCKVVDAVNMSTYIP